MMFFDDMVLVEENQEEVNDKLDEWMFDVGVIENKFK